MSRERIYKICKSSIPSWQNIDFEPEDLQLVRFNSMTNTVFSAELPKENANPRRVLIRIFADSSKMINKRKERTIFYEVASQKLGPNILAESDDFRVEQYLYSRTLMMFEFRNPLIIKNFAERLCDFHYNKALETQLNLLEKNKKSFIARVLDEWLEIFKSEYPMYCAKTSLPENLKILEELKFLTTPQFLEEFTRLLPVKSQEVIVSHNDILGANLLQMNKDLTKMVIIDYEYCSFNYRGFDLSLFVTESAMDYSYPEIPYCKLYDEAKMDMHEINYLCECYLKHYYHNYYKGIETYEQYSAKELPILIEETLRLEPLNTVMWGMWGITTIHWNELSKENETECWNYAYAKLKFDVYNQLKKQFLAK